MYDFAIMVLLLSMQFIREYTSKVDDLVKDRIESQKEEKAKENEEKEIYYVTEGVLFMLKEPT